MPLRHTQLRESQDAFSSSGKKRILSHFGFNLLSHQRKPACDGCKFLSRSQSVLPELGGKDISQSGYQRRPARQKYTIDTFWNDFCSGKQTIDALLDLNEIF